MATADRKAGIEMAARMSSGTRTTALGAAVVFSIATALAACTAQRPGAVADHSLDAVERTRAGLGVTPADTSYDQAERNRLTLGTRLDASYDAVERVRAGRVSQ